MKKITITLFMAFVSININAQTEGVSIGPDNTPPHSSAMLDIQSTTKGLLIPRVDLTNLSSNSTPIPNPITSLLVYNTNVTTGLGYHYYDGSNWVKLGDELWKKIGITNDIRYDFGKVQVGSVAMPTHNIEVNSSNGNTFKFKGPQGELRFGQTDAQLGGGVGSFLTQTANTILDYASAYSHLDANGVRLFELITYPTFTSLSAKNAMYIGGDDNVIFTPFGRSGSNPAAWFNPDDGTFTYLSDSTVKTNVSNISPVLSKVMNCRPVLYNMQTHPNSTKTYGFIAQEIEQIFPELISEISLPNSTDKLKGINYQSINAILLGAIQEQQALIEVLQQKVNALENQ
ncbi:MAG: tail fiber domain-containing protein [Bacteroidota bacterium]|nr:tail fiber domain-containing protein [Bacteroidota bacterium]